MLGSQELWHTRYDMPSIERIIIATLLAITTAVLGVRAEQLAFPPDVGTNHLGVLWPGSDPEYTGAWVRPHPGPFVWGLIERTPGTYDWRESDLVVEKLQGERLAVLATVWPFASWDQRACHLSEPPTRGAFKEFDDLLYMPCDMPGYLAWLAALVERYDGDGVDDMPGLAYPIRHWEVLNEPEMQGPQLTFFQEPPDVYCELLRASYHVITTADPLAVVLPAGQSGMHREATAYWRPILQDETVPFDVGNIHSIRATDMQQESAFWAPEYLAFLADTGRSDVGYWITEAQVGAVGPKGQMTDAQSAEALFIGTVVALAEGAEVILHVLANDPKGEKGHATVDTANLLGRMIGSFASVEHVSPYAIRFDMPGGEQIYALWKGGVLPAEVAGTVMVTTYLGTTSSMDAREVSAAVSMLAEPLPTEKQLP